MKKFILINCLFTVVNPKWALVNDDCRSGQFVYFDFNFDYVDNHRFSIPKNYKIYGDVRFYEYEVITG